jgi:DNA-binding IscR family transcriptional regulator
MRNGVFLIPGTLSVKSSTQPTLKTLSSSLLAAVQRINKTYLQQILQMQVK